MQVYQRLALYARRLEGAAIRRGALMALATLAAVCIAARPAAAQDGFTLTILHTNDTHGRIEQTNRTGSRCTPADAAENRCFGGVARRATVVAQVRAEGRPMLLLDGGDQFQGTLYYTLYKGAEAQLFMGLLGYDAMAVGNHEFDDGPANLARFAQGLPLPLLSANIDVSAEPSLTGLIPPYTVLEAGGERIGVVGFTTEDTAILSSPGPNVRFLNIEQAVSAAVAALQAQGIDKIIGVSHSGYTRDLAVAAAVDGLDVIVGGHTNTYLANNDPTASGPYPKVVKGPGGAPVLVVQDYAYGVFLGQLDVTFDDQGVAATWQGGPILLDAAIPEDPAIRARVQEMSVPLEELRGEVVGVTSVDLNGDRSACRFYECNMGNLVADAMLWQTAGEGVQIVIQNGGGLRTSIPAGEITLGDILEVLPFSNNIATFELTGADVIAALENGVSRALSVNNEGTGRFPQVGGMRYTWNPDRPPGARIVAAELQLPDGSYTPLLPATRYKVATNDFLRRGGDGYQVFADDAIHPYDAGANLEEAVAAYIRAHIPIAPALEGRVQRAARTWNAVLMVGLAVATVGFAGAGSWVLTTGSRSRQAGDGPTRPG